MATPFKTLAVTLLAAAATGVHATDCTSGCSAENSVENGNIAAVDQAGAGSSIKVGYSLYLSNPSSSATCTVSQAQFYIPGHCEGSGRQVNSTIAIADASYALGSGNVPVPTIGTYQNEVALDGSLCGGDVDSNTGKPNSNVQLDLSDLTIGSITCDQPNQVVCVTQHYYITPTADNPSYTQNATNGQYSNSTCVQACYAAPTPVPTTTPPTGANCVSTVSTFNNNTNVAVADASGSYIEAGYQVYLQDASASATCAFSGLSYALPGHCEGDSSQISILLKGGDASYVLSGGASNPSTAGAYQTGYNFTGSFCGHNTANPNAQIDSSTFTASSVTCDQPNQVVCVGSHYYVTPTGGNPDYAGVNQGAYNTTCFTACYNPNPTTTPTTTSTPTTSAPTASPYTCSKASVTTTESYSQNDKNIQLDDVSSNGVAAGYYLRLSGADSTTAAICQVHNAQVVIPGHSVTDSTPLSFTYLLPSASYALTGTAAQPSSNPADLATYQSGFQAFSGSEVTLNPQNSNPKALQIDSATLTADVTCDRPLPTGAQICMASHYFGGDVSQFNSGNLTMTLFDPAVQTLPIFSGEQCFTPSCYLTNSQPTTAASGSNSGSGSTGANGGSSNSGSNTNNGASGSNDGTTPATTTTKTQKSAAIKVGASILALAAPVLLALF